MYKGTHDFMQQKADARNPFRFAHGDEVMTDQQKRDVLTTKLRAIEKRLAEIPANHGSRAQLIREKSVVEASLSELKDPTDLNGIERFFVTAAREVLSLGQFNSVMGEAVKMLKRYKELEQGLAPQPLAQTPQEIKKDLETAVREFVAKGGSVTKLPPGNRKGGMPDPQVAALTPEQNRVYKKLRSCGICKEDALREARKP